MPSQRPDVARIRELEAALTHQRQLNEVYRRRIDALQDQAALAWRLQVRTLAKGGIPR
jgi:hypothetical protein